MTAPLRSATSLLRPVTALLWSVTSLLRPVTALLRSVTLRFRSVTAPLRSVTALLRPMNAPLRSVTALFRRRRRAATHLASLSGFFGNLNRCFLIRDYTRQLRSAHLSLHSFKKSSTYNKHTLLYRHCFKTERARKRNSQGQHNQGTQTIICPYDETSSQTSVQIRI